jgi:hypothetical protein
VTQRDLQHAFILLDEAQVEVGAVIEASLGQPGSDRSDEQVGAGNDEKS